MSQSIQVNGQTINYPQTGDTNWGDEATDFAVQTSSALAKVGLSTGTTVDLPGTLDVTGNTTLDANLSVGGNASVTGTTSLTGNVTLTNNLTVNGNTQLGNANTDTINVTGIVNVDSGVLYVDPVNNRVGINDTTPSQALDVTGNVAITGNETVGGTLDITGDVAINTNKFNVTASSGNTTIAGTLGVTGNTTVDGVIYADDNTTANTPVISFTGDTNTGIGRSAADTLDFITNGNSRFRVESTGQIKAVYESQIGTDYNTTLHNGYFCRAWVNFDGTAVVSPASATGIRASGNISSILDNGTGDYTINFTTNMVDADYSAQCTAGDSSTYAASGTGDIKLYSKTDSSLRINTGTQSGSSRVATDYTLIDVAIFR